MTISPVADEETSSESFLVSLEEFSGPFDVLLSLIAKHRLDVTALSLHQVTDDFLGYIKSRGSEWTLNEATEFLVIAATLLDLKAARLLPSGQVEDEEDIAVLEARDLLLARLLQYRAFKLMSSVFQERLSTFGRQHPRSVGLDPRFQQLLPEVVLAIGPDDFANLAARALEPKIPDNISVSHIHAPRVSVREQAAIMADRLKRTNVLTFRALTLDCDTTLLVVARFLALLELYRDGVVLFDQPTALGELTVRWVADENQQWGQNIDEFDKSNVEVEEFATLQEGDSIDSDDAGNSMQAAEVIEQGVEVDEDTDEDPDEDSDLDAFEIDAKIAALLAAESGNAIASTDANDEHMLDDEEEDES